LGHVQHAATLARGYYGTCLPLGHVAAAMFAPYLLGCRGTM
jgi:hypothetical protein